MKAINRKLSLWLTLVCLILSIQGVAQEIEISKEDWKADIEFLSQTVHKDYPFLYKKISEAEWDEQVVQLNDQIDNLADHEIVVGIARLVSSFGYGHTSAQMRSTSVAIHRLPINLYHFSDGVYIQGVHKDVNPKVLGSKVVSIEGHPVEEVLQLVKPAFPSENDQFYKAYGLSFLTIPEVLHAQKVMDEYKTDITYTLEKNGETFDYKFSGQQNLEVPTSYGFIMDGEEWKDVRDQTDNPLYLKDLDRIYQYEYLPEHKLLYVRQSQIQDDSEEDIPTFYRKVFDFIDQNEVEKFVLDVRLNGGGNNYKNKPVITGIIQSEKINETGRFFAIIGRRTFSACQNLINELDNYTNVLFVGEPSAENINFYGDVNRVTLPNSKMVVRLSFAWWQDKPQWENKDWTQPHMSTHLTFDQFTSNQDPALQAVIDFKSEGFIKDPMAHFTNLFLSGNIPQLQSDAVSMVKDPRYSFFDFEGEFNSTAYRLLGQGQIKEAVFVFTMNSQLFPESANAWDSLAEGYWKSGDIEKAKDYYNKAISLDPDGPTGNNARAMLKQIEDGKK